MIYRNVGGGEKQTFANGQKFSEGASERRTPFASGCLVSFADTESIRTQVKPQAIGLCFAINVTNR